MNKRLSAPIGETLGNERCYFMKCFTCLSKSCLTGQRARKYGKKGFQAFVKMMDEATALTKAEKEELMEEICSFYEYELLRDKDENIIINNKENCYKYKSAEAMINDWADICKKTNKDYIQNGLDKPFKWL